MTDKLCECGCGKPVRRLRNRFLYGHQNTDRFRKEAEENEQSSRKND